MTAVEFAVEVVGWAGALLILLGYLLITAGQAHRQVACIPGDERLRCCRFCDQRLVAWGAAFDGVERRLAAHWSYRNMADLV